VDYDTTALERFIRREDVNGLAGAATIEPDFVPIDFLLVKEQATTFDEALDCMRWADKICTLVSVQTRRVKNPQFLKVINLPSLSKVNVYAHGDPRILHLCYVVGAGGIASASLHSCSPHPLIIITRPVFVAPAHEVPPIHTHHSGY